MSKEVKMDKKICRRLDGRESWEAYAERLTISDSPEKRYFYQHVVFDHYGDFTRRFQWFRVKDFDFYFENWTAERIHREIRFDEGRGRELDLWYKHVEDGWGKAGLSSLLHNMEENHTWPLPPVVFEFPKIFSAEGRVKLTPVHLIEGTHRVSYLKKILLNAWIKNESEHRLLVLKPKLSNL